MFPIIPAVLLFAVSRTLGQGKAGENLQYDFKSFKFWGGVAIPRLTVTMAITNSYSSTVKVKGLFLDVFVNDKAVGKIAHVDEIVIPKLSVKDVSLETKISQLGAAGLLFESIKNKQSKFTMKLKGSLMFNGLRVPIDYSQTYDVPKL